MSTDTKIAILIDPFRQVVEYVNLTAHDTGSSAHLQELYDLLDCDTIQIIGVGGGDVGVCDEEGMLKDWDKQAFFLPPFYPHPVVGKWLITRYADTLEQELEDCKTPIEPLRAAIRWVHPKVVEVPAPTFTEIRKDGTLGETTPLDDKGRTTWTYKDNPSKD